MEANRVFESGATRSDDLGRIDPEAALSPLALERYSEYILKHRRQSDGALRDMDNWQKGIPLAAYAKGLWRHLLHFWQRHRGWTVVDPKAATSIEEDLCAIIFNAQGYLHEILKEQRRAEPQDTRPSAADEHVVVSPDGIPFKATINDGPIVYGPRERP